MSKGIVVVMMAVSLCLSIAAPARAAVDVAGDTDPVAGDSWWLTGGDANTTVTVGNTGHGSVVLDGGSSLLTGFGYLAREAGSTGLVTVVGAGSTWTSDRYFWVGQAGHAELDITNGGSVSYAGVARVGELAGSSGDIRVDGTESILHGSYLVVGDAGDGTLAITGGGMVEAPNGVDIASQAGGTGRVTVDGADSTLDSGTCRVGNSGQGWMSITNGGTVTSSAFSYLGYFPDSMGEATVDGLGSMWYTGSNLSVGRGGDGTLTITNGGRVDGPSFGVIGGDATGTGKLTVDGVGSTWTSGSVDVGDQGKGTLIVTNGGRVESGNRTEIGAEAGAEGVATVDGAGSTWVMNGNLRVGDEGDGSLTITRGGSVSTSYDGSVGTVAGVSGTVTVDGTGSTWTSGGDISVGQAGEGTLTISNGAVVSAVDRLRICTTGGVGTLNISHGAVGSAGDNILIASNGGVGTVNLQVSGDNMLIAGSDGSGVFENNGLVRTMADPTLATGTYIPISVAGGVWNKPPWSGTGSFQSLGGVWNLLDATFVTSALAVGGSGEAIGFDVGATQRVLVTDVVTGGRLGVGFDQASTNIVGGQEIVFSATSIDPPILDVMPTLAAWDVTTDLDSENDVLLSFEVGNWYNDVQMDVWYNDGGGWARYPTSYQSYGDGWASFLITDFNGAGASNAYAVTGVPEPATLFVMGCGAIGLLRRRRREYA